MTNKHRRQNLIRQHRNALLKIIRKGGTVVACEILSWKVHDREWLPQAASSQYRLEKTVLSITKLDYVDVRLPNCCVLEMRLIFHEEEAQHWEGRQVDVIQQPVLRGYIKTKVIHVMQREVTYT